MNEIKINSRTKNEDALIIGKILCDLIKNEEKVMLDLCNDVIKTTILVTLLTDIINLYGISTVEKYIRFKNIHSRNNLNRVLYGTFNKE